MERMESSSERNWAVAVHLTALFNVVSAPLLGLLAGIVAYVLTRDRGTFVRDQAREALNLQITLFTTECALLIGACGGLYATGGVPSAPFFFLAGAALLALLGSFALGITGAMRASRGESYRYPFVFRFVK